MKTQVTQLKANAQGDLPLLQITDTHLFSDRNKDLLGIKTVQSFEAVIEHAAKYSSECQAVLSTGDLSQDHSAQSYIDFTKHIKKLAMPCYCLPGNHDQQSVMLPSLLQQGLTQVSQVISDYWQIIMLGSQVEGVAHGELAEQQLDFLQQALNEYPDKYALVCLHHHVLPVGSQWLDQHILKNSPLFLELISSFKNVCAVLSGHVHQTGDTLHNGIRFLTTPSTCVQFKPNSDDFSLDQKAPGYRYLSLNKGGDISTHVERIESGAFIVNSDAKGY
jgi:Icc protein